jgi:hydroxyacylglutathione hydrolase
MSITIQPLSAFTDNYIWVLRQASQDCVVVDPGDSVPVLDFLAKQQYNLSAILLTHHHADHTGGVDDLLQRYPQCRVFALNDGAIAQVTDSVSDGQTITVPGLDVKFTVMAIPGHTLDHVAYYSKPYLFCGDTLFLGGCGRVFEGTMPQMYASLRRLTALPDETLVYCAHEYTAQNLLFAKHVEPDNHVIDERLANVNALGKQCTIPASLALEKRSNPFLRCELPSVIDAASRHSGKELASPEAVFAELRAWKDQF